MTFPKTLNAILFLVFFSFSNVQSQENPGSLRLEVEQLNTKIEQLYLSKNVQGLVDLYRDDLTFFAEYQPAILDKQTLQLFFADWFKSGTVQSFKKNIRVVERYADYILEIGTVTINYIIQQRTPGVYTGKYMMLWARDSEGKLTIVSDAFGADVYIEPDATPYASVHVKQTDYTDLQKNIDPQLMKEVKEFDKELLKVIAEGNGEARANGFTDDAIMMGNFDSIRTGMKSIKPKLLSTYTPNTTYKVQHTYSKLIDLGDYIFANGYYRGGPTNPKNGGSFEGKMSNLLKRNKGGTLVMHRQLGNRDEKQD